MLNVLPLLAVVLLGQVSAEPLVAPGAKVEKLWGEGEFTEGGAILADGSLVFSDIGNAIMRFDPVSKSVTPYRKPSGRSNGMIVDPQGRLIVAEGANTGGGRRVSITERDGTIRTLADSYQGKRFNSPNDVAVDRFGRVYMSDPRYVGDEPRELDFEGVFRIDPDGKVAKLDTGASKPNGMVVSPDGKTLYIADNGPKGKSLIAADLDEKGNVSHPRILVELGNGRGIDGMTVTTKGWIVATAGSGADAGVYVFDPQGKTLGTIPVPDAPANVEFGGPEDSTLYIMAGKSLYRVETLMKGYRVSPAAK